MDPSLLQAIQAEPADRSGWLVLSDWLEEEGRADEAEFVRLREALTADRPDDAGHGRRERRLRELLVGRVRPPAAVWTGTLGAAGVPVAFSLIPPGRFLMGSRDDEPDRYDNEGPRHRVTITRPFYLGVYPVTQAQWTALMGDEPFSFHAPDRPADSVSAHEAENFCRRASEALGREVRLPYEAEWEHACRGGTRTMFYTG
ncbi:MAG: SUMF1/EgtB/PvdO family nonheme iron enzyme, partial [Gemmataceae bacterium]